MRFLIASLLVAAAWSQCQPSCPSGKYCYVPSGTSGPGQCIDDPCLQVQCAAPQRCRVETSSSPKGVCYTPACEPSQQATCVAPRSKCTLDAVGGFACSDPCFPAGTTGPVCPQTQPICTANTDGTVKCSSPCDDPQACPAGSTCRFDASSGGKTCEWPDPCANNPCAQSADKKCVGDTSVAPPTFTCQNACEPNPCTGAATTCSQVTDAPFYTCTGSSDPCANYQCDASAPKCIVDQSTAPPAPRCVNPCTYGTASPCAQSSEGPVCQPTTASPFYVCSNPCNGFQCDATAPQCVVVGGQPTCQNPCTRSPSPCQTGACNPQPTSPFYKCVDPCNPSPCQSGQTCRADSSQANGYKCIDPCNPSPCQSGQTCRADSSQANGYTCVTTTNPCSPNNPCTGSNNVCVVDASQPNGYKCTAPADPCRDYQCPATTPKCVVETSGTSTPAAKCVNPCAYGTASPCAQSSEGPVCQPTTASPFYTCSNPCAGFQCTSSAPQCVIVEGQATCQNPCTRSPSPCQTGTCSPTSASPFFTCSTNPCQPSPCTDSSKPVCVVVDNTNYRCDPPRDPCNPSPCQSGQTCRADASAANGYTCVTPTNPCSPNNPCTGSNNVCVVDASQANGYKCTAPANPCEPNPCTTSPNTVCTRSTSSASGYTCTPPATTDPCANNPCTDSAKPICVKDTTTQTGYTCQPRPNPCADSPCRNNAEGKFICVPKPNSASGTVPYECQLPCTAYPCGAGLICTPSPNEVYLRTCTPPVTDPCIGYQCPATQPKCVAIRDPATNAYRGVECVNPCLTAAGNPCVTSSGQASICTPSATETKGYTCSAPVTSCDTRPCPEGQICSMSGTNIVCTIPDPCAPSAAGVARCPSGQNCRRTDNTVAGTASFECVDPCKDITCTVGNCVAQQTATGFWQGYCPSPCGNDCVAPRRCVQDPAATGAVAYKCISYDVCTSASCKAGETCVPNSSGVGFTCVAPNPCAQCTPSQICVAASDGTRVCKDPCSACTSTQRCVNVDANTGTATCTEDPCLKCQAAGSGGSKCGFDKVNNGYVCFDECLDSRCPTGTRCAPSANILGKSECQTPPTCADGGVACPSGQFCINGACKSDPCANCNRAEGFACTQTATATAGAAPVWGCFYQPCAVLKPCLQGEVCKDSIDATTNALRAYTCIKPTTNTATPTSIQVSLTVTLNINADVIRSDPNFNANFAQETADLVNIPKDRIVVTGVAPSSNGEGAVVTFTVRPASSTATGVQTSSTEVADRLNEKLEAAAATGTQVGNGQYTNAMATGAGAQQVQSAVYQCSNGAWVDSQSQCPAPVASTNLATLAVGVVVGVVGALALVGTVIYCKKNKAVGGASTGTEMV